MWTSSNTHQRERVWTAQHIFVWVLQKTDWMLDVVVGRSGVWVQPWLHETISKEWGEEKPLSLYGPTLLQNIGSWGSKWVKGDEAGKESNSVGSYWRKSHLHRHLKTEFTSWFVSKGLSHCPTSVFIKNYPKFSLSPSPVVPIIQSLNLTSLETIRTPLSFYVWLISFIISSRFI